jgi:hypothetical protein
MVKRHTKPTKENKGGIISKKVLYISQTLKILMLKKRKKKVGKK